MTAARCDPAVRPYYRGLRAHGKTPKQAPVACMRKPLLHLNAVVRKLPAAAAPAAPATTVAAQPA